MPPPLRGRFARSATIAALASFAALVITLDAHARAPSVIVSVYAATPIRVQVARSPSMVTPCDASENEMIFDGMVDPEIDLALEIQPGPLCIRNTYDDFPEVNWGASQLWTRRYRSPLRVFLDGRAPP